MRHYSILVVEPPDFTHNRACDELVLALQQAFAALGYDVPRVDHPADIRDRGIVFGAGKLAADQPLPPELIIYNLEQIDEDSPWLTNDYMTLLKRYPVWDYSARNIERLKAFGVERVGLCGIGYMPVLTRIPPADEDLDVLFVGSINERRHAVLQEIGAAGKRVMAAFDLYGEQRDALVARAKIILNLHFYNAHIFEIVRVSYMLANRKCVVSEFGNDDPLEAPLREGVAFAPYDALAGTCLDLLEEPRERQRLAQRGFELFSGMSQVPMLERALAWLG